MDDPLDIIGELESEQIHKETEKSADKKKQKTGRHGRRWRGSRFFPFRYCDIGRGEIVPEPNRDPIWNGRNHQKRTCMPGGWEVISVNLFSSGSWLLRHH